jgi:hypothetical protein
MTGFGAFIIKRVLAIRATGEPKTTALVEGITILKQETMEGGITKFIGLDLMGKYHTGYLVKGKGVHMRKFGLDDAAWRDYADR